MLSIVIFLFCICVQVVVVIADKRSDSTEADLEAAVKPLVNEGIRVIPVALGNESDSKELEVISPTPKDVVHASDSVTAEQIADTIIDTAVNGNNSFKNNRFYL